MTMTSNDILKDTQYIDVIWLQTHGLHKGNALDYFATSPFFDRNSNNQTLINQGLGLEFLSKMTGLEFNVTDSEDPKLFIVNKCHRENAQRVTVLEIYYILEGVIYQSPVFIEQVQARVSKTSYHILNCFTNIQEYQQLNICNHSDLPSASSRVISTLSKKSATNNMQDDEDKPLPVFTNTLDKFI